MHQRKGKKILIYFFLLLLVGSINNINFNNLKFKDIKYIKIAGLGEKDNLILLVSSKFVILKYLNLSLAIVPALSDTPREMILDVPVATDIIR